MPSRSASPASTIRPVRQSSRARAAGSAARAQANEGGMPRGSSGNPKRAVGSASRTSEASATRKPPASAGPLTAAITGTGTLPIASKQARLLSTSARRFSASPPNWVVSIPEQKAGGAPVIDHGADLLAVDLAERLGDRPAQLDRQRVALLGPVQRQRQDAVGELGAEAARSRPP